MQGSWIAERENMIARGDLYSACLDPVIGSEQGGVRPVLVIQNDVGNRYSPTVIVLAVTGQQNKAHLPTHVSVPAGDCGLLKDSVVLAEQIRTLDKRRLREKIGAVSPEVIVKDNQGNDISSDNYTVTTLDGRKNVGNYTYVVTFKNDYEGSKELTLTINPAKLTSVGLSYSAYTYNGKVKTPTVTAKAGTLTAASKRITDSTNVDLTYSKGRKNVGSYKVTVKGRGNYTGTITKTFKINPKGTSISKLTKGKKSFTVKWKKQSGKMAASRITGYQYRYSTSSKMTNAKIKTVKGYSKTSAKRTGLKAKKKYYVQVRTYKKVSGTTYYSAWSKVRSVKTK